MKTYRIAFEDTRTDPPTLIKVDVDTGGLDHVHNKATAVAMRAVLKASESIGFNLVLAGRILRTAPNHCRMLP